MRSVFASKLSTVLFALAVGVPLASAPAQAQPQQSNSDIRRIQALVDDLRSRLSVPSPVTTAIVPLNPLLVTVEPSKEQSGAFVLSFESAFLESLDDDDLRAVIAHELGHVWIFTHHPYLQTERLANDVALRAVSRDSLERVYGKVWERAGTKGDLVRFLGQ